MAELSILFLKIKLGKTWLQILVKSEIKVEISLQIDKKLILKNTFKVNKNMIKNTKLKINIRNNPEKAKI